MSHDVVFFFPTALIGAFLSPLSLFNVIPYKENKIWPILLHFKKVLARFLHSPHFIMHIVLGERKQ